MKNTIPRISRRAAIIVCATALLSVCLTGCSKVNPPVEHEPDNHPETSAPRAEESKPDVTQPEDEKKTDSKQEEDQPDVEGKGTNLFFGQWSNGYHFISDTAVIIGDTGVIGGYTISGNRITITISSQATTYQYQFKDDGNTLLLHYIIGDGFETLNRVSEKDKDLTKIEIAQSVMTWAERRELYSIQHRLPFTHYSRLRAAMGR